jgi:PadR family transcriptional regulator PadR
VEVRSRLDFLIYIGRFWFMRRPSSQTWRVLEAMATEPVTWFHGYELSRTTGLASGTLYPILIRLAERGWLEARWDDAPESGPRRHLCRITAVGRRVAEAPQPMAAARSPRVVEQSA